MCFFFQAEDGIRDVAVTGVQTCALPISRAVSYSIGGKRLETNRWTINGMDYVGTNSQGTANAPNGMSEQLLGVDAVRKYNALGHSYGAEYGKRSGGQITVGTTSGTNQ